MRIMINQSYVEYTDQRRKNWCLHFDAKSHHFNNDIQIIIVNFVYWYLLGHWN